jgi:alpha-N-acetylglucosaminidase
MKRLALLHHSILVVAAAMIGCIFAVASGAADPAEAAQGVLKRSIGERAKAFSFQVIPEENGKSVFEVEALDGKVTVRGNSGVAMCRGAYTYLREACGGMVTWSGAHLALPERLPDHARRRVVCPYKYVLQDNICAFGYTTAFYGWEEWEKYLDWMALHGCNLQMSPVGGEAVWARVWKQFGVTDEDLRSFFSGPAFLPWHRMGNIYKHGGPLPASYLEQSVVLEKKILGRMRELGIHAIAPAFSGFVPPGFKRANPDAKVIQMQPWGGFDGSCRSQILHPLSPLYPKIGRAFISEWRKEFGNADFYQADSFNEMEVPVPQDREKRLEELAQYGEAIYGSIRAGDPDGTWVMMAWLFLNPFWTEENAAALLSRVPNDKMILLDLYCEGQPQWNRHKSFYGKQWVWSILPNWGGNSQLGGRLEYYAQTIPRIWKRADVGNLVGFGTSPEGTENNEVIYELATDAAWADASIDLSRWLESYCKARYGACPEAVREAWTLLTESFYGREVAIPHYFQARPEGQSYGRMGGFKADERFAKAVDLFLSSAPQLKGNSLYLNDALEFSSQYLAAKADERLRAGRMALDAGEKDLAERCMREAFDMLGNVDTLLGSHPMFRLERWVGLARKWGKTPDEKNYYEEDAKRQITVWGGPMLSEYACRVWSGLVAGYYLPRWRAWYEAKRDGKPFDMRRWEEQWITTPGDFKTPKFEDPIAEAQRLADVVRGWDSKSVEERIRGVKVGEWHSGEPKETYTARDWDATQHVGGPGTYQVLFQYTGGSHRLDIEWAALLRDGQEVARDAHPGTTGERNEGNRYQLDVKGETSGGGHYTLRARVKSAGGVDSNGVVYLKKQPSKR